jgi:hypothetical protein
MHQYLNGIHHRHKKLILHERSEVKGIKKEHNQISPICLWMEGRVSVCLQEKVE